MKDQSFSVSALAHCLYSSDFYDDILLNDDVYRENLLKSSAVIADSLFEHGISLNPTILGEKQGYCVSSLSEKIILRRCVKNVSACSKSPFRHRNIIAKELSTYLKEGSEYTVYRLDIKSFFESVDVNTVKQALESLKHLSVHTQNIINTYLSKFAGLYGQGLPRGVEISPILADVILKSLGLS